jgi:hypothetical protein
MLILQIPWPDIYDDFTFNSEMKLLSNWLKSQIKSINRQKSQIPYQIYTVWKTLQESLVKHKLIVLLKYSTKAISTINTIYYQIARAALGIKSKP